MAVGAKDAAAEARAARRANSRREIWRVFGLFISIPRERGPAADARKGYRIMRGASTVWTRSCEGEVGNRALRFPCGNASFQLVFDGHLGVPIML
jgi:hypothetical protein